MSRKLILGLAFAMLIWLGKTGLFSQSHSYQVPVEESEDALDKESRIGLSYLEHTSANGQAQECGDCLVRVQESFDSVMLNPNSPKLDGAVIKTETWIRFRFDHRQNRFLFGTWTIEDRLELGLVDPVTEKPTRSLSSSSFSGWCYDEINHRCDVYSTVLNRPADPFRTRSFSEIGLPPVDILKELNPIDFRAIGLNYTYDWPNEFKMRSEAIQSYKSRQELFVLSNSRDSIGMRHFFEGDKSGVSGVIDYVLDSQSLMVTKSVCWRHDAKTGGKIRTSDEASYEWIELDGIFLPTRIVVRGVSENRVRGTDREWGASQKISDIHWFSINQPFDETAFDGSEIMDEEAIRKLLDPNLSQATSILEKIKKEKVTVELVAPAKPDQ